jgi:UDP-4-amino-4,6-dideoxy-N-acetyl-beta-L-altrosamine transaminase
MINYGRQSINKKDIKAVVKVLKSNFLTQGPNVGIFEKKLSMYFNSKYAVAVSSGTSGLNIAAKIFGWSKRDIIFSSPITFLASANCIENIGATPKFVDINLEDYSIDLKKLEEQLKKYRKKNKSLIVTDYAGHPSDWLKISKLKKKYNLKVINDNCHAMGAKINGDKGYASRYADISILSFHPVKAITTGEGGAILTNNSKYFKLAKELRSHGVVKDPKKLKNKGNWYYEMRSLGENARMSEIHASLGCSQITKLNSFIAKRNRIAKFYNKFFKNRSYFTIPKVKKNFYHAYHLYPLLVDFKKLGKSKKKVFSEFKKKNINLQVHYIPINTQPYYKKKYGFKKKNYKNSLDFYNSEISMPIYFDLSDQQLGYIKKVSEKIFKF